MIRLFSLFAFSVFAAAPVFSEVNLPTVYSEADEVAHGGGCRKSSPPGQCCHLEIATGIVHCH